MTFFFKTRYRSTTWDCCISPSQSTSIYVALGTQGRRAIHRVLASETAPRPSEALLGQTGTELKVQSQTASSSAPEPPPESLARRSTNQRTVPLICEMQHVRTTRLTLHTQHLKPQLLTRINTCMARSWWGEPTEKWSPGSRGNTTTIGSPTPDPDQLQTPCRGPTKPRSAWEKKRP